MAFKARLSVPSKTDKHWINKDSGGYNRCILGAPAVRYSKGSVLPNCVGYAWGRFLEILGKEDCKLSTGNAGTWYDNTGDGYRRSQKPQVGAVICFGHPSDAGHVGIVEQVNSDGSIVTSESGWNDSKIFWTRTRTNSNGNWGANSPYYFQGFIYNPSAESANSSKISALVNEANKHINEGGDWTWRTYGESNIEWCGAFIVACAKTVGGLLGVVIYNTASAQGIIREGVKKRYGFWNPGPGQGKTNAKPAVGDIAGFRTANRSWIDEYDCNHVGIVVGVTSSNITTIEGNTGTYNKTTSKVLKKTYSISDSRINGYYRPDWIKVGDIADTSTDVTINYYGNSSSGTQGGVITLPTSLYSTSNDSNDMTVREVGYLNSKYEPSINSSNIRLSVINYTTGMSSLYELLLAAHGGSPSSGNSGINTDKLPSKPRMCVDFLLSKGLSAAAACGVAGNIKYESEFDASLVGDNGTSFGICQWHLDRGKSMKKYVGSNWASNLSGQLDYLWYDLTTNYKSTTLSPMKQCSNDVWGARQCADIFVRNFEVPDEVDKASAKRQDQAAKYFNSLVIVSNTPVSVPNTSTGNKPTVNLVTLPSSVNQAGITRNHTNYSYWYSRWSTSSVQYKLSRIWSDKGKKSSRNIATIDGYYLMALSPIFGTTGDIVRITLHNGDVIDGLLADAKGSDATSPYGHVFGSTGQVDVVEWEAVGSESTNVGYTIELGSWAGVKVKQIENKGSYFK